MKYKLPKEALQYHCSQRSPAMQHCRPYSTAHNSLLLFLSRLFRCIRLISSFELNCSSSLRSMFTTPLILSATSAYNAASVCSCACRSSNLCIFVCRCHIRSSCATSDRSAIKSDHSQALQRRQHLSSGSIWRSAPQHHSITPKLSNSLHHSIISASVFRGHLAVLRASFSPCSNSGSALEASEIRDIKHLIRHDKGPMAVLQWVTMRVHISSRDSAGFGEYLVSFPLSDLASCCRMLLLFLGLFFLYTGKRLSASLFMRLVISCLERLVISCSLPSNASSSETERMECSESLLLTATGCCSHALTASPALLLLCVPSSSVPSSEANCLALARMHFFICCIHS